MLVGSLPFSGSGWARSESVRELKNSRKAICGIPRHGAFDGFGNPERNVRRTVSQAMWRGTGRDDREPFLEVSRRRECICSFAGKAPVRRRTERVNVTPHAGGRCGCADPGGHLWSCDSGCRAAWHSCRLADWDERGTPEVAYKALPLVVEEQVRRLDVVVQETSTMCSIDPVACIPDQRHDTTDIHAAAARVLDEPFHGSVLCECGHDIPLAGIYVCVANGQDMLVREVAEGFSLNPFGTGSKCSQQLQDGDIVLVGVMNEVGVASSSCSKLLLDGVAVSDDGAGRKWHDR